MFLKLKKYIRFFKLLVPNKRDIQPIFNIIDLNAFELLENYP